MGKKTIRVDEDAFDEAKQEKEKQGQTWDEYLTDSNRTGPDADDVATELTSRLNLDASVTKDDIATVKSELQEIQEMLESAQESWEYLNGEEIHGTVHESDHELKDVIGRLDDLESQLPRKIAEEIQR